MTDVLVPSAIVVSTALIMEGGAWALHRYVMHGWGWGWHKSHHEPHDGWFELNDAYAIVFALVAIGLFVGASRLWEPFFWVAAGMTLYGLGYAVLHDGLVHQRWPFRHRPRNAYLKRLVQAHKLHHAVDGREGCVSFGFLYAPPVRQLKQALQRRNPNGITRDAVE